MPPNSVRKALVETQCWCARRRLHKHQSVHIIGEKYRLADEPGASLRKILLVFGL
ncbi:MAG: hypothetical protein KJP15_08035 [Gammaproteobacteria bacterium]|nr:hypothetical protein [Gammaproteobacteria bacterium]